MANDVRDNFSQKTKGLLEERAGFKFSNPNCRVSTSEASINNSLAVVRVGEAAHICAAALNGTRYDKNQSHEERFGYNNGNWLCATSATMIDKDPSTYILMMRLDWKIQAELRSSKSIGTPNYHFFKFGTKMKIHLVYFIINITYSRDCVLRGDSVNNSVCTA